MQSCGPPGTEFETNAPRLRPTSSTGRHSLVIACTADCKVLIAYGWFSYTNTSIHFRRPLLSHVEHFFL